MKLSGLSGRYVVCLFDEGSGGTVSFSDSPSFASRVRAFEVAGELQAVADGLGTGDELVVRDVRTGDWWRLRTEAL